MSRPRMKSFGAVMLTLVAFVLAVLAFREARGARQARAEFASAAQERDVLRKRLEELEKKQSTLRTEPEEIPAQSLASPDMPPRKMSRRVFNTALAPGKLPPGMEAFDSPEMRQLMAIEQKGRLDARYAALFRELRLSPEKLEAFKQLLVDRQNAPMDVMAAAMKQSALGPDASGNLSGLIQQEAQNVDAAIRGLLGETAYEEFQDFNRTQSERSVVDQLASRLSYSETPLTPEQADALVNLLSAERATQPPSPTPDGVSTMHFAVGNVSGGGDEVFSTFRSDHGTSITDNSLASAQTVLTEAQMSALRALQMEQQAQQKMREVMQQSFPMPGLDPTAIGGTVTAFPASDSAPRP